MNKPKRKIIQNILFLIVLIFGSYYLWKQREGIVELFRFKPFYLFLIVIFTLFVDLTEGFKFKINMNAFGLKLNFHEWFGLTVSNTMYNYFLPVRGGMAIRAAYLKKRFGFKLTYSFVMQLAAYIMSVFASAVLYVGVLLLYLISSGKLIWPLIILFSLLIAAIILGNFLFLIIIRRRIHLPWAGINRIISYIIEASEIILKDKVRAVRFMVVSAINILLRIIRMMFAYWGLFAMVSFLDTAVVQSLSNLSLIIAITPGNIGIEESLMALSSSFIDIDINLTVMAALATRTITMSFNIIIGLIYSRSFFHDFVVNHDCLKM